jgi:hypothetical protein
VVARRRRRPRRRPGADGGLHQLLGPDPGRRRHRAARPGGGRHHPRPGLAGREDRGVRRPDVPGPTARSPRWPTPVASSTPPAPSTRTRPTTGPTKWNAKTAAVSASPPTVGAGR